MRGASISSIPLKAMARTWKGNYQNMDNTIFLFAIIFSLLLTPVNILCRVRYLLYILYQFFSSF